MSEKKSFVAKMFAVRCSITKIKKSRDNDYHHSKYFDINDALQMLNPILQENRLLLKQPVKGNKVCSIIQDIDPDEDGEYQFEDSWLELPTGITPQKMGSAITYYRRYTLVALFGLEAEDDDGNTASGAIRKEVPFQGKPTKKTNGARVVPNHRLKWLDLSDVKTGDLTQTYHDLVIYKETYPSFTREHLLKSYKVNNRDQKYLDEIFPKTEK